MKDNFSFEGKMKEFSSLLKKNPEIMAKIIKFDLEMTIKKCKRNFDEYTPKILSCFSCEKCGEICCKNLPVELGFDEIAFNQIYKIYEKVKQSENIKFEEFEDKYLEFRTESWYIKSPCPFLKENKCSIYDVRPIVCRRYPFEWDLHITTIQNVKNCPLAKKISSEFVAFSKESIKNASKNERECGEKFLQGSRNALENLRESMDERRGINAPIEKSLFILTDSLPDFYKWLKNKIQ